MKVYFLVDALFGGMPANHPKDLNSCMQYFFDEPRPTPHSALKDAQCVKRLCEHYAENLQYDSFHDCLNDERSENYHFKHQFSGDAKFWIGNYFVPDPGSWI